MYMGLGWTPHPHHHHGGHGGGWGGGFWDGGAYPVSVEPDVVAVAPSDTGAVSIPPWALWAGGRVALVLLLKGGR